METKEVDPEVSSMFKSGAYVVMFQNRLGSFTSIDLPDRDKAVVQALIEHLDDVGRHITDAFTPEDSLQALADKHIH